MASREANFSERVVAAASQGAAGAIVAACLSSVTEPIVNRILVKRMGLSEAIAQVDLADTANFFNTVVATNFIKFPFFEVINMALENVELPGTGRGAILGAIFTTATLPITNYRYCKSVGAPVDFGSLYKAYLPTVLRDIVYGICRNSVMSALIAQNPDLPKTAKGRFTLMFMTVMASCLISAPGNEVRGYYLQNPKNRLPVREFFKPYRFIRSTAVGALIMSTALGVGTLVTGPAQARFSQLSSFLDSQPIAKTLVALFLVDQFLQSRRHAELMSKLEKKEEAKK
uniref:ADP,ATP carrier protein n=1 Tax=Aplanochytrium stocchinoi TaxID=215587 RepID=A0A7S3PI18_9STRA|mmetsp:Transcript_24866/g.30418  ORF Transcript_24866/g.30418 Transcript_24866/m.30418 type:complete len:286 (+) Transcript_24866:189-1046(+)|eukprot:CAMPEP_0204827962 /NCGR_PEP_ID=MMETSP1346-20131115/5516_1 /ASSEMBLY_ACC=CAM_ASM_000771 /TAXON_ID=215587 /ORGANISM="Aplanochytrium stocchinoi, Strain GSBS06" /LENGTH=285 /DNA_ID=CAMNT_0051956675 /DNA_START=92 /DNA_END=949 /DNA_ORIENTATION=-